MILRAAGWWHNLAIRQPFVSDCNANSIGDECEVPPQCLTCEDCDEDGVPDDCQELPNVDGDDVPDCVDACPSTTPSDACGLPAIICCWFPIGIYATGYPRDACLTQGGTPICGTDASDCESRPCAQQICLAGCLLGDLDGDGYLASSDLDSFTVCLSGAGAAPTEDCSLGDLDSDGDVDLLDAAAFQVGYEGAGE